MARITGLPSRIIVVEQDGLPQADQRASTRSGLS
jgi:hypothetical protein